MQNNAKTSSHRGEEVSNKICIASPPPALKLIVMQSVGNSFCGDVVLDNLGMAYRDEDITVLYCTERADLEYFLSKHKMMVWNGEFPKVQIISYELGLLCT